MHNADRRALGLDWGVACPGSRWWDKVGIADYSKRESRE